MEYLNREKTPALFLDIKMQDISGTELAELLPPDSYIIFTTAYPDYAVKGFEMNAVDYLLKPISFSRFLKACHKLKKPVQCQSNRTGSSHKNGTEIVRVKTSEIYYIEACGNYLKLYTSKGIPLHRQTLKEFVDILPGVTFIRTHKSYVVNIEHISCKNLNLIIQPLSDFRLDPSGSNYLLASPFLRVKGHCQQIIMGSKNVIDR